MMKKGRETNGKGNTGRDERDEGHKDVGAGPNQREEEREEGRGEKEKGGGAYLDQDTEGGDGGYSYPLVTPGLGEVLDNSTSELCAGTDRSTVQYHGTMVNPSYSQHLEGRDGTDMGNDTLHGHDEGKQEGQVVDDSNSNKEAEGVNGDDVNKTINSATNSNNDAPREGPEEEE